MGNIGEPKRIIEFEPLEEPAPVEVPEAPGPQAPVTAPAVAPQVPEKVPG